MEISEHAADRSAAWPIAFRGGAIALVLLFEIIVLDGAYSFRRAVAGDAPAAWRLTNEALQVALYVTAFAGIAFLALAFAQRRDIVSAWMAAAHDHKWVRWFAAQTALFAVVVSLTPLLQSAAGEPPWLVFAAWIGLGCAMAACAVFALAPVRFWRVQGRRSRANVLAALAAGAVLYATIDLARDSWRLLSGATLDLAYGLLQLYERGAYVHPGNRVLGAGDFQVVIDAPCSGYEGIGLVLSVLGFYIFAFRRNLRFPHVLALLPIGAATIWLLNGVRLALLVSIGVHFSPEIALQGFHSQAGWIFFLLVTLSMMLAAHRMPALRAPTGSADANRVSALRLATALLVPFAALMAARLLGALSPGPALWSAAVAVALPLSVLIAYRHEVGSQLARVRIEPVLWGLAVGGAWIVTQQPSAEGDALGSWLARQPSLVVVGWLLMRLAAFVVIVPISEELLFRGYLHRALVARRFETVAPHAFTWLAFIVTSLLFGALHQRWLSAAIAGAVFAVTLYRTKSLAGPVTAHVVANGLIAAYAVAAERWELL